MTKAMITVHHLNQSRAQRILWLLEELGQPYEIVHYQRDPQTLLAPPALKAIHPLGKSPVVQIDGEVLAESGPSSRRWPSVMPARPACVCCKASWSRTCCSTPWPTCAR